MSLQIQELFRKGQEWFRKGIERLPGFSAKAETTSEFRRRDQLKRDVENQLERLIEQFQKEALGYSLFIESSRRSLTVAQKRALFEKHAKVMARPYVRFAEAFRDLGQDYDLVDQCVKEYMRRHNMLLEGETLPTSQLEEALLKKAKEEAGQILDAFLEEEEV